MSAGQQPLMQLALSRPPPRMPIPALQSSIKNLTENRIYFSWVRIEDGIRREQWARAAGQGSPGQAGTAWRAPRGKRGSPEGCI